MVRKLAVRIFDKSSCFKKLEISINRKSEVLEFKECPR